MPSAVLRTITANDCTATAVHICFGYAAITHERPNGYSFLPELAQFTCKQISLETAQSQLAYAALARSTASG